MTTRDGAPNTHASARREALQSKVAREETNLRRLEAEQVEAKARLSALQSELAAWDLVPAPTREPTTTLADGPRTPVDKVKLFRQLFRGRPDLYPTRFVSKKTGKPGYAPACSNKFVPGVCELPKVKCGDCTKQAFRPFDDAAVFAHLKGQHVMGVYAMLDDETCWFLAVDFDKGTWTEDARAFVETSRRLGLPAVVERSLVGLTATPLRRDGHHPITQMQLGPVRFSIDAKSQAGRRPFEHRLLVRETAFRMSISETTPGIQEIYAALARDELRNEMILNDVIRALEDHRSPILLTERKDHLEYFATRLERVARHEVRIFDYVDRDVPMLLRMFEKRLRGYRAIGYARGEAPLGYDEPSDERVIEYDEDVLAALDQDDDFA